MKQLYLCLVLFICLLTKTHAQTKAIAFKSHSGNMNGFAVALANGDMDDDNFGLAPSRTVKINKLDSVKFISEEIAVLFTSNSLLDEYTGKISHLRDSKDTLYNHPLFSRQHSLDSIKRVLKAGYNDDLSLHYSTDSTRFIGFDNGLPVKGKKKQPKKEALVLPASGSGNNTGNNHDHAIDGSGLLALGLTIGFLLPISLLLRRVYQHFKNFHPETEQSFT